MSRYDGILYVLKHDLKHWERKYEEATNDVDAEVAENAIENNAVNIGIVRKAAAYDEIAQIYDENTGLGEQDEDSTNFETLVGEVGSVISSVERGGSE